MTETLSVKLASTLDVDAIGADDLLADLPEWDSLGVLSVVAMVHSEYGVSLGANDLKSIETCRSLAALIERLRSN